MDIFEEIVELRRAGRRGALATIVNARGSIPSFASAKMLVRDDGTISGTIGASLRASERLISRATSVEPVNATPATRGSATRAAPVLPSPEDVAVARLATVDAR